MDDLDCQNDVLFGMRLKEKNIPVYKTEESIIGLTFDSIFSATSS